MPRLVVRDIQNFLFGFFLIGVGILAIAAGWRLPMGEAVRMGSGYMPKVLGALLILFGAGIGGASFAVPREEGIEWSWRPLLVVLGSFVVFALTIERIGLPLSIVLTMLVSRLAIPERRWVEATAYAVVMAIACSVIFRELLGLPLTLWPF